jgi:peptide/nickel transport system substrate-binding protein
VSLFAFKETYLQSEQLKLWKQYQQILTNEQPRTFLYYYDELEGLNERVKNVRLRLLATFGNMYDWKVKGSEK